MVHPYLKRRGARSRSSTPRSRWKDILGRTLGIPLFQEQMMRVAIEAAGFTPAEADSTAPKHGDV